MNLRTLLILGRVSNLPTVWSNVLAGAIFADIQNDAIALAALLAGASFLYIGGMYLNDFCDHAFDAKYCPARPIPAGRISRGAVGGLTALWFFLGLTCLALLGWPVAAVAALLAAAVIIYDYHHKGVAWAPALMGFCRFLLYPLAALAAPARVDWTVLGTDAAALGLYVAGITYLARGESRPGRHARWALLLLLAPLLLPPAVGMPTDVLLPWLAAASVLPVWMGWLLIPLWRKTNFSLGRIVSGLLAGIVLVDFVAVTPVLGWQAGWFFGLFFLALLLQRFVPAT